jgi:hypothetical protein
VKITLNKKKCVFCNSVFCNQNTKVAKNILKTHIRISQNVIVDMGVKAYYRGYECDYEDGLLTYKGTPQFMSCCQCKKHMRVLLKPNNQVYLTCEQCRENQKERRRGNRVRLTFIPDDDENDINNS